MDINTAKSELAHIESQFAALQQRRDQLRQFIGLGEKLFGGAQTVHSAADTFAQKTMFKTHLLGSDSRLRDHQEQENRREYTLKHQVLGLAKMAIGSRGPMTTRDLLAFIEGTGVTVTGADKLTTVSVILSRSDEFVSDRTKGWSLVEKNPQDAATSAGSSPA